MKSALILTLTIATTSAAAFFVGRSTAPTSYDIAAEQADLDSALRELGSRDRGRSGLEFDDINADNGWTTAQAEEGDNPLSHLSSEALEARLKRTMELPQGTSGRATELNDLLRQLAITNPSAALDFASQIAGARERRSATNTVLESWAREDPTAALDWFSANSADLTVSQREERLQAVLRGYADASPENAVRYAQQLGEATSTERRLKTSALQTVFGQMVENGQVNQAISSLDSVTNESMRNDLEVSIMRSWGSQDPEAAAAYLANLGEDAPRNSHAALVRSWVEINPDQAAAHVTALGVDHPDFGRATATLIARWTDYDIGAPGEWLNTQPASPEVDRAVAIYTAQAAREDPEGAMSWASSIQNDRLRSRMMERVAGDWREVDPVAFDDYINQSEFTDEQRQRLTEASPGDQQRGRWGRGW